MLSLRGTLIGQPYDLSVSNITPPGSPTVGVAGSFVVGVSAPGGATSVTVTAVFTPAVTFNAPPPSSAGCAANSAAGDPSTTVTCPATGATSVTINVTPLTGPTLAVVAGIIGNELDPNMTNNSAIATTNVSAIAGIKGDFNGDGKPDIVWRNYATGQNAVWLMNGTSYSGTVDLPGLPNLNYRIEGVGDFNGDGKVDILWRNYATGQNAVWLMNGTTFTGTVDLPALSNLDYRIEGVGDFNGDGKMDILWRNYATGQNAVWLMNGTSFMSIVDLPALPNVNYRFDAVADYNGDGKPDIVLRNYATGQNAIWIMNGTALSTIIDLPALTDLHWEIAGPK